MFTPMCHSDDNGVVLADLYDIYQTVQSFCGGISDGISHVSGISKINTVVTAVGTAAAGGALYAGIKKSEKDEKIADLSKRICDVGGCDPDKVEAMTEQEFFDTVLPLLVEMIATGEEDKINQMTKLKREQTAEIEKSKRLGHWRTGLLAGTVGTNVASAIISGLNKNQSDLIQQISACNAAVNKLSDTYKSAIANGVSPIENPVMQQFQNTINNCGNLNIADVEKIEKRMGIVMGTSIAGVVIGAVGTGTSIAANTDAVRNDNTESGKKKEKTLNTVSNIAAGANVITGGVETGFNVSLIVLTKNLMRTAQLCEDELW